MNHEYNASENQNYIPMKNKYTRKSKPTKRRNINDTYSEWLETVCNNGLKKLEHQLISELKDTQDENTASEIRNKLKQVWDAIKNYDETFQSRVRKALNRDALQKLRYFEKKILEDFVFDESAVEQLPIKIKKTIVQPFIGFFLHLHPDGTYIIYDWSDAGGF